MEAYTKRLRWMAPTNCADILLDRAYAEADDHRFELAERRTNLLRDFGMIYGIVGNNPVLAEEVTVIDTYVYQSMRTLGFSYSTAIGLFQSLMGLILITANQSAKKINDGEGLF